jgi:hypothetical protein
MLVTAIRWFEKVDSELKVTTREGVTVVTYEFANGVTLTRQPTGIVSVAQSSEGKELARATLYLNDSCEVNVTEAGKEAGFDTTEIELILDAAVRAASNGNSDTLRVNAPDSGLPAVLFGQG